jgi:predicted MFS family arabinose efflux permease
MSIQPVVPYAGEPPIASSPAGGETLLTAATVWLAALGCGVLVATIYYAQPLIDPISRDIGLSRQAAGLTVTVMQVGFGLGLALIVPLADRYENRRLVTASVALTTLALACMAFARSPVSFLVPAAIAGVACVGAQVLVPMIAGMASADTRGRVIGTVMAGLLSGIMLARPAASFAASVIGWRGAFLAAAAVTLVAGILLRIRLPVRRPPARISYLTTLRSTLGVVARHGVLRRRMLYQTLLFAVFTAFWTTVPLLLVDRFGFDQRRIAAFALAGAGGALAAPLAGRLADRGSSRVATVVAAAGVAAMMALTVPLIGVGSVVGLTLCAVLFDGLVQTNHIVSQRIIFALSDTERARINSAYMTSLFLGGAVASALGPLLYERLGWGAVAVACVVLAAPVAIAEIVGVVVGRAAAVG